MNMTNTSGDSSSNRIDISAEFLRKLELLNIISRKVFTGKMRGERRSRKRGASVEFADFREYCWGDDFRYIDWNAFGRLDRLFLKLFVEEEDLFVYFLIDTSPSMDSGMPNKLLYARKITAALGYIALANFDSVCIGSYNSDLRIIQHPAKGKAKIFRVMDVLNGITTAGLTSPDKAVESFLAQKHRHGMVFVISDMYELDGLKRALTLLKFNGYDPVAIQVLSPQEINPDLKGSLRLMDSETKKFVEVTVSGRLMKAYRKRLDSFCGEIGSFCRKNEIGYYRGVTDVPFEDMILRYLRKAYLVG